ncbi:MAG: peptide chain release factor 1 [Rudaea sp.]
MNPSIRRKLDELAERHQEVALLLAQPEVLHDNARFRDLSREFAQLDPLTVSLRAHDVASNGLAAARAMLQDPQISADKGMRELAEGEIADLQAQRDALDRELNLLLLPKDARDEANIFLEVRAGTGGDEAAIFAGDLFRMYSRYAERQGWNVEVLSANHGEHGGFREVIARVEGKGVFSRLKFESGAHCVKRVPVTEAQGRVHTSTATVAVLPEMDEIEDIQINPADLKTDTFRASGAGGQHVNKTDSAIRITHLPTGIVVECQDERSQHKNRARALSLLKARLLDGERSRQASQQADARRLQVGTGNRSERIRTYRYKDNLVTDHRIGLDLYRLPEIMDGDLDSLIGPLTQEFQADQMKSLTEGRG